MEIKVYTIDEEKALGLDVAGFLNSENQAFGIYEQLGFLLIDPQTKKLYCMDSKKITLSEILFGYSGETSPTSYSNSSRVKKASGVSSFPDKISGYVHQINSETGK